MMYLEYCIGNHVLGKRKMRESFQGKEDVGFGREVNRSLLWVRHHSGVACNSGFESNTRQLYLTKLLTNKTTKAGSLV